MKMSKDFPKTIVSWDLFVLIHRNRKNVVIHFFSFLLFWLSPILAILVNPYWIIGFFISGLLGTLGHYIFSEGVINAKDATSNIEVVVFSSRMAALFVTGRYWDEITYVNEKWMKYKNGEINSTVDAKKISKLGVIYE